MTSGSIPSMSFGDHVNTSTFSFIKSTSWIWFASYSVVPTLMTLSSQLLLRRTLIDYSIGSGCVGVLRSSMDPKKVVRVTTSMVWQLPLGNIVWILSNCFEPPRPQSKSGTSWPNGRWR